MPCTLCVSRERPCDPKVGSKTERPRRKKRLAEKGLRKKVLEYVNIRLARNWPHAEILALIATDRTVVPDAQSPALIHNPDEPLDPSSQQVANSTFTATANCRVDCAAPPFADDFNLLFPSLVPNQDEVEFPPLRASSNIFPADSIICAGERERSLEFPKECWCRLTLPANGESIFCSDVCEMTFFMS
jgi:hypothetical protein